MAEKYSKAEVSYESPAKGMHHCSECVHFQPPSNCNIVEGLIRAADWCEKFKEKSMEHEKKKHGFTHTHMEHHKDGSHTIHHVHEAGPEHDVKHAVADLDGAHDSMEENLGQQNAGEHEANAGVAGLPGAPAPAAGM